MTDITIQSVVWKAVCTLCTCVSEHREMCIMTKITVSIQVETCKKGRGNWAIMVYLILPQRQCFNGRVKDPYWFWKTCPLQYLAGFCTTYKCLNLCQRKHLPTVAPVSLPKKVGDLEFMLMNGCTHWQRIWIGFPPLYFLFLLSPSFLCVDWRSNLSLLFSQSFLLTSNIMMPLYLVMISLFYDTMCCNYLSVIRNNWGTRRGWKRKGDERAMENRGREIREK